MGLGMYTCDLNTLDTMKIQIATSIDEMNLSR